MKIINAKKISYLDLKKMYSIYAPHHNMEEFDFFKRTTTFDELAIFKDKKSENIIGFLGIKFRNKKLESGTKFVANYFGSLYVEKGYRGNNLIGRGVMSTIPKYKLKHPFKKIYVWGDAISYKSYIMVMKKYKKVYPSLEHPITPKIAEIRDYLGDYYYGNLYNSKTGCITKETNRLKNHEVQISDEDLKDKNIKYYSVANPNYAKGDGLLCVIPNPIKKIAYNIFREITKKISKKKTNNKFVVKS